ncbi:hypothetical protein Tco_0698164 [Tanacetum coccineum]
MKAKTDKSSIDEPPEVELKDLPPHLEYVFLEGDNKLPVIIAKDLSVARKKPLIKVFEVTQRAMLWKLSDKSKGINPDFCYSQYSMGRGLQTRGSTQRRVNPKIHNVIKKEVKYLNSHRPRDQTKTTFTCPSELSPTLRLPLWLMEQCTRARSKVYHGYLS